MDKSLRTIYLYGILKTLTGRDSIQLAGDSVYELIDGLSTTFEKELRPTPDRPRIVVKVRDFETEESITTPLADDVTEIHVYPTLLGGGGGNGGLFKIIIGVIMVAVVVWAIVATGGAALLMAGPGAWGLTWFGSALLTTGIGLIMGGLMEVMMPQPKLDMSASNDIESSKYLGATQNTVKIGTPIPLLMGRHKFYGHIISFNVDAKNVAA